MGILRGSDAARSWEGSAVLGVPPMSDCRGFPHSLLHQDTGILPVSIYFRAGRMPTLLLFIQSLGKLSHSP
ncbi:MAG: hypothetical protein F6K55_35670 [Moorea sp. SIO4A3]|nr:hypothetical protein [Moorena sp. SIO4A3]